MDEAVQYRMAAHTVVVDAEQTDPQKVLETTERSDQIDQQKVKEQTALADDGQLQPAAFERSSPATEYFVLLVSGLPIASTCRHAQDATSPHGE